MNKEELNRLINEIKEKKSEETNIEIKAARFGCPSKLHPTLSSFSNQNSGGIIIFGVDESNDFEICGVYDPQDLQKKVTSQAKQMNPQVYPDFSVDLINGKPVVTAEISPIPPYQRPCYDSRKGINNGSYKRIGDADTRMDQAEIFDYMVFQKSIHSDREEIEESIEFLNKNRINEFLTKAKQNKSHFSQVYTNDEILTMLNVRRNNHLTKAGALIFSDYPQMYFPQLSIHALAYPGIEQGELGDFNERFLDNKDLTGSIPDMLTDALEFIRKNIRNKTIIDSNGVRNDRYDYPLIALREAILNALVHRDYSKMSDRKPITLNIFKDRIEIISPGGIFGGEDISSLGKATLETRNENIVKILEILNITENRYSGIPTMRNEMKRFNLPEPVFHIKNNEFKVTFYNSKEIKTENQSLEDNKRSRKTITDEEILEFCRTPKSRKELKDFFNTPNRNIISKRILPLVKCNKLKYLNSKHPQSPNQEFVTV